MPAMLGGRYRLLWVAGTLVIATVAFVALVCSSMNIGSSIELSGGGEKLRSLGRGVSGLAAAGGATRDGRRSMESLNEATGEKEDDPVDETVKDMADQKERMVAEARVAKAEVESAERTVKLKKKVVEATEDRVGTEKERYDVAAGEVDRLKGRIKSLRGEVERYADESEAKSYESWSRIEAAKKILESAGMSPQPKPPRKSFVPSKGHRKTPPDSWGRLLDDNEVQVGPRALDAKALEAAKEEKVEELEKEKEEELEKEHADQKAELWRDSARLAQAERGLQKDLSRGRGVGRHFVTEQQHLAQVEGRLRAAA